MAVMGSSSYKKEDMTGIQELDVNGERAYQQKKLNVTGVHVFLANGS